MAAACRQLLDDPVAHAEAVEAARRWGVEHDWGVIRDQLLVLYASLLDRPRSRTHSR
jgi:hypothetical protein